MLLEAERKRVLDAVEAQGLSLLLTVQDTTKADYTGKRASALLGSMSYEHQKGLFLHNHVALTPSGNPLGLFDQFHFERATEALGTHRNRRKLRPFEEKESYRWFAQFERLQAAMADFPSVKVVDICDREADIQELLQARRYDHVHYLIRSRGDRKAEGSDLTIRQEVGQTPVLGTYQVEVRDEKGKYVRMATLSVQTKRLTVNGRVAYKRHLTPTDITVILAIETGVPEGIEPLDWLLVTSLEVNSLEDALQVVGFYALRWRIELFHYVLKQGYQIEELQLKTPQALQNAIVLYSLMALQVMRLRYWAQEQPQAQMQLAGFDPLSFKVAALYLNSKANARYDAGKQQPTVQDFLTVVAHLGGSMLWKNKTIGLKTLWRGQILLSDLMVAYRAFQRE